MKNRAFLVNCLWMMLLFDYPRIQECIEENTKSTNISKSFKNATQQHVDAVNSTKVPDSEFSGSERNRRLIPYMTFYLPPSEFPISQQYTIQGSKPNGFTNSNNQPPPTAIDSSGPLPPPSSSSGYLTVPTTYIRMKLPSPTNGALSPNEIVRLQQQQQQQQQYRQQQPNPLTYGGHQYPLPTHVKEIGDSRPILHLLPPNGVGEKGSSSSSIVYKPKTTVQHFPPTSHSHKQGQSLNQQFPSEQHHFPVLPPSVPQQSSQQHHQAHHLNKNQFTPFTSSNTVPGDFIPIIYTPGSADDNPKDFEVPIGDGSKINSESGNTINYNYDTSNDKIPLQQENYPPPQQQQQQQETQASQHQKQHSQNSHKQINFSQTASKSSVAPSFQSFSIDTTNEKEELQYNQQQPQVQFIALSDEETGQSTLHGGAQATSSSSSSPSTSSPIYHVINEASSSSSLPSQTKLSSFSTSPQHQPLIAYNPYVQYNRPKQQQHQKRIEAEQQSQKQHEYLTVANNMTPQEEYVLYLRQQQQQQQQRLPHHAYKQNVHTQPSHSQIKTKQKLKQHDEYTRPIYHLDHHDATKHSQQTLRPSQSPIHHHPSSLSPLSLSSPYPSASPSPSPQIYVLSTTLSPVANHESTVIIDSAQKQRLELQQKLEQQRQKEIQQYETNLHIANSQHNYPQHSPIAHAVFPTPELSLPSNHQPPPRASKPLQQILEIPVRAIVDKFTAAKNNFVGTKKQRNQQKYKQQATAVSQNPQFKHFGSSTPQYVDNHIDDEKNTAISIEQHYQEQPVYFEPELRSTVRPPVPPQAAYIVITTMAPPTGFSSRPAHHQHHHQEYMSTSRPFYNNQPVHHLQPISSKYTTPRPSPQQQEFVSTQRPLYNNQAIQHLPAPMSSKYSNYERNKSTKLPAISTTIVTTPKPEYEHLLRPTLPIKLKPSSHYDYPKEPSAHPQQTLQPIHHKNNLQLSPTSQQQQQQPILNDPNQLPDIHSSSLSEILHKLQASNHLPKTLTADNIDNSIKTLIKILHNLKLTQTVIPNPSQHHEPPPPSVDYDYSTSSEENYNGGANEAESPIHQDGHPGPNTGRPGIDYPNYAVIPETSFDCNEQRYKGFFGDPETNCQVWHYCDLNGGKASFLCPNGTIFSQIALTCDWWFNVKCSTTAQLYVLNERLYKYILPFNPKFPEDYSGPLVDKYLALKFQEMEEKMRLEKQKGGKNEKSKEETDKESSVEPTTIASQVHHDLKSQVGEQSVKQNLLSDEIEDFAQQGTLDTIVNSTPNQLTTTREASAKYESLDKNPIVVPSSTTEVQLQILNDTSSEEKRDLKTDNQQLNNVKPKESIPIKSETSEVVQQKSKEKFQTQPIESSGITVEKVEVIEIKPDGVSGHLMPDR